MKTTLKNQSKQTASGFVTAKLYEKTDIIVPQDACLTRGCPYKHNVMKPEFTQLSNQLFCEYEHCHSTDVCDGLHFI